MYFDFDDRYSDVEPVGRAINLRDGVVVSVVVPSQNINDQRVITHNFQPGSSQRLVVSFNPASKTFDYQLN